MRSTAWTGWISFAAWMMILIGFVDFFEGLIAIIRDKYYVMAPNQVIVFDVTTWGWITMLLGIVLICVGFALGSGAGWARWFSIIAISFAVLEQLSFLGNAQYPLWALTVLALSITVLYALIARWGDYSADRMA
jgi:hypothetical protein